MITASRERVSSSTSSDAGEAIRRETERRIAGCAASPGHIDRRLRELDEEWDVERTLEMNASALTLAGLALGIAVNRRWLILPPIVQGFFMQHALQGWCPPLPVLRRLGFRTQSEIEAERYALKVLRGDFKEAAQQQENDPQRRAEEALEAVHQ